MKKRKTRRRKRVDLLQKMVFDCVDSKRDEEKKRVAKEKREQKNSCR